MLDIDNLIQFSSTFLYIDDEEYNSELGYLVYKNGENIKPYYLEYECGLDDKLPEKKYIQRIIYLVLTTPITYHTNLSHFTEVVKLTLYNVSYNEIIDYSTIFPKLSHIVYNNFNHHKRLIELNSYLRKITFILIYNCTEDDLYDIINYYTSYINNGLKLYIDVVNNEELFNRNDLNDDIYNKFELIVNKKYKIDNYFDYEYNKFKIARLNIDICIEKNHENITLSDNTNNVKELNITLSYYGNIDKRIYLVGYRNLELIQIYRNEIIYDNCIILDIDETPKLEIIFYGPNIEIKKNNIVDTIALI